MDWHVQKDTSPDLNDAAGKDVTIAKVVKKTCRWRGIYTTGLYLALLIAGVFLADQVHVWWMLRQAPMISKIQPTIGTGGWRYSEPTSQAAGIQGIFALEDLPSGMDRLDGDPGDLPSPPEALRLWAFRRSSGDVEQYAKYDYPGSLKQAGDFYVQMLKGRGYHLVSDQSQDAAKRLLVFASPSAMVVEIILYKKQRPADSVDIGLRVRYAGRESAGQGCDVGAAPGIGSKGP